MTLAAYLLKRIREDARLAYYFDPITQSMEMLTAEFAKEKGLDMEEFRQTYYAQLRFERPQSANCECDGKLRTLRSEFNLLTDQHAEQAQELFDARAQLAQYPAVWYEDSSLETWFPLTAEELERVKSERDSLLTEVHRLQVKLKSDTSHFGMEANG